MELAQIIMVLTLVVMILGIAPLYLTAVVGTTMAAIAAGFQIMGSAPNSVSKLLVTAMHPVIIDMLGVLLFIGIMQVTGFMDGIS